MAQASENCAMRSGSLAGVLQQTIEKSGFLSVTFCDSPDLGESFCKGIRSYEDFSHARIAGGYLRPLCSSRLPLLLLSLPINTHSSRPLMEGLPSLFTTFSLAQGISAGRM